MPHKLGVGTAVRDTSTVRVDITISYMTDDDHDDHDDHGHLCDVAMSSRSLANIQSSNDESFVELCAVDASAVCAVS